MQDFSIQNDNLENILKQHKLSHDDYKKIENILNRAPNIIELGIFSAMWSEHCSYKSSKIYLKGFPTKASWVLQGPGENAGVIDLGKNRNNENLAAVFKIESHNHPSFIEPNAGAATGVGGILRDIFTMGANPIINLNTLYFGNILDAQMKKKHTHLLHGVVEGIGHYGNCMGIPTIGGQTNFEACYNGNILVNAFSLGIAKHESIFYGKASGEGNPIIYVGSKTGRDGLGGAVMSSDSFNSHAKTLRPTVQIGDPFIEKLLLEACLEIFRENLIVGIQDMGAAGLTSSSFEMASRSQSGMVMWLDKIPMRESGMNPYELMLSESQERMLLCAKKGAETRIKEIFEKYELDCEIVGEVKNSGKMELFWQGKICADLPIKPIVESAPELHRPIKKPKYLESCKDLVLEIEYSKISNDKTFLKNALENLAKQHRINSITLDSKIKILESYQYNNTIFYVREITEAILREMISSIELTDKAWIYNQYDSSIKASTIKASGMGDASIVSLKNYDSQKAIAVSAKCNSRYCYLNPREGAKIAVAQSGRNVALSGAKPLAITDCLNFGSPENPEVMYQFKEACEGIKEACQILNTPVVSGNVSLYNQTNNDAIYPTPSIVSVGILEDYSHAIASHFVGKHTLICVVGGKISESFAPLQSDFLHNQINSFANFFHSFCLKQYTSKETLGNSALATKIDSQTHTLQQSKNISNKKHSLRNEKPYLNFSGSMFQKILNNPISGNIPSIDLECEKKLWDFLYECTQTKLLLSAKDIAQGGIGVTLAKMAIIGQKSIKSFLSLESLSQFDFEAILNSYNKQIQNILTRIYSEFHNDEFSSFYNELNTIQQNRKTLYNHIQPLQKILQYIAHLGEKECIIIHEILRDLLHFSVINPLNLFAENHSQIVCEVFPHNLRIIKEIAHAKGLECYCIGKVNAEIDQLFDKLQNNHKKKQPMLSHTHDANVRIWNIEIPLCELSDLYYKSFEEKVFNNKY
ncbi:phosphoribosylformylglycinamidine synthase subunit PurL [Helicobacter didelphidarum]|uniref:Phosphoribosylformylglycinamidine synthase subunit PurL n=1 Tax=Helicobacter didelphidarum TaxID=2040648 RepID=A0A3D8ISL5_9HELI|nr:phosphoribosylformylglycinamidine synthase subunit PurL [Helicobacter didelphidarum]RDU67624.1 phosphoribosylformylglycinamidine synthase subunit PurL [Helicobacter didelphidarum]